MNNRIFAAATLAASLALLGGCATTGAGGPAVDPLLARGERPGWQLTVTPVRMLSPGRLRKRTLPEGSAPVGAANRSRSIRVSSSSWAAS